MRGPRGSRAGDAVDAGYDRGRRRFLALVPAFAGMALAGCDYDVGEGMLNACRARLPADLARLPLVRDAFAGLDAAAVWDVHCHVFGNGDSGGGAWFNPSMQSLRDPQRYVQRLFFMNAGCAHDAPGAVDRSIVARLVNQLEAMPAGMKAILLAFDWARDERGAPLPDHSTFRVPDEYARDAARAWPAHFEWAASIHPYDPAALDRLDAAAAAGARSVKWLPSAQNIDPASPRCDRFYRRLAESRLPLLTHAGDEKAVRGHDESLGNPLKLRRPLDAGVRVIVAHCASLGEGRDLDRGAAGPATANFALFARLMDMPAYASLLHGDVSALAQANRMDILPQVLARTEWHARLLNGSDYPLPGVLPLVSLDGLAARGLVAPAAIAPLRAIRQHNALLFDFVLKRSVAAHGRRFPARVFATRDFFVSPA